MNRRSMLKTAGSVSVIGCPLLGGCLGDSKVDGEADDSIETDYLWSTDTVDELVDVADGTVSTWERYPQSPRKDDAIVGLDVKTGERQWTYVPTVGGMDPYSKSVSETAT